MSTYLVYNLLLLHHLRVFSDGTEIQPFLRPVEWYLWFVSRKRRCQAAPTWLVVFPGIGVDCDATVLTPPRHGAAIIQPARNQPILEGLTRSLRLGLFCDVHPDPLRMLGKHDLGALEAAVPRLICNLLTARAP